MLHAGRGFSQEKRPPCALKERGTTMQIKKLVPPLTELWKATYEKERPNLTPNAISGEELSRYVRDRFSVQPSADA